MADPLVRMSGIRKAFPGVVAVDGVDLEIHAGEILGLVGENGAGKSTLMRILAGIERPDAGQIVLRGQAVAIRSSAEAFRLGIGMVFQDDATLPNLRVCDNIFLGREIGLTDFGVLNNRRLAREAKLLLERIGAAIPPDAYVRDLPPSQRPLVELARALVTLRDRPDHLVIILDECTSGLSEEEVSTLFAHLAALRELSGMVLISHRLDEVLRYADRVVVMKDGRVVAERKSCDVQLPQLHELMVGRELVHDYYCVSEQTVPAPETVLEVRDLHADGVRGVSLAVRRGEILGLAGLVGSGRRELLRAIYGDLVRRSGQVYVRGVCVPGRHVRDAVRQGLGYVPADRRGEGVIPIQPVLWNLTLPAVGQFLRRCGVVDRQRERRGAERLVSELGLRAASLDVLTATLSGGNQQKVVVGRWLLKGAGILLMDQPTRGIDVGAKHEIYRMLRRLTNDGCSILLVSDELPELIGLSSRILVFREGMITHEVECPPKGKPAEKEIIRYA